ncbi:MAG TPA: hypothetical protein VFQ25_09205 [Ktedonobacterales bacterium]|nr:hypothetical protein [Ktedonobacterales bacterium]
MPTDSPRAPTPAAPTLSAREGRVRVALSLGGVVVLLASYFTGWGDWYLPDPGFAPGPNYLEPFVPFTTVFNPQQGFNAYALALLVGPPLLSALFASLTLLGSRAARRLFATFSLITGLFCLLISVSMTLLFDWVSGDIRHRTDAGGAIGFLASLLVFGAALSLSAALPGASIPAPGLVDAPDP